MRAALAAAVLGAFTIAQAQDKPAASPPPSWQQGKPAAMQESTPCSTICGNPSSI